MDWEYESDTALEFQEDESEESETDEILESLLEEEEDEDYAERSRRARARRRGRKPRRKGVPTARGASTYRTPGAPGGYVTQQQFKEALGRVGTETRRNADGIKAVNLKVGKLDSQVGDLAGVSRTHQRRLGVIDNRMKIDGALDFASAISVQTDSTTGTTQLVPDFTQLLRGAVKNGVFGEGKGALSNPWVVGGIGLALRPGFLGSLLAPK